jgi:hypothetical protein
MSLDEWQLIVAFIATFVGFPMLVWLRIQRMRRERWEMEYLDDYADLEPEPEPAPRRRTRPAAPSARPTPLSAHAMTPPDTRIRTHEEWWPIVLNKVHHLLVVGTTQEGKSTSVRALVKERARTDLVLVVDPHGKLNRWGVPAVGIGRRWTEIDQTFQALQDELSRRYREGEDIGHPLSIFIDEYPTIASNCSNAKRTFLDLAREGAKVKMRLVILTQSPNVEALGISGEGDARDNFSKLLLSSFAIRVFPDLEGSAWPAALEHRFSNVRVDRSRLLDLAERETPSPNVWQPPGDVIERIQWTHEHVLVAAMLAENPTISRAEAARRLWGGSGAGRRNEQAGELIEDVQRFLKRSIVIEHDA